MRPKPLGSILALMAALPMFAGASWDAWRVVLRALFALPMTDAERETYQALTGRTKAPAGPCREAWLLMGRRSGKSRIAALIAVYMVTCRRYRLAPGERGVVMVLASDRAQARVVMRYIAALLRAIPALERLVAVSTAERIELTNGLAIEVQTSSYRSVRGRTCVAAICDEICSWPMEDSANPDSEILAALRPAMSTVPDALLVCISSPYAKRGEAWRAYQKHFGQDGDALVVNADTVTMNPTVPAGVIRQAFEDDAIAAMSEYGQDGRVQFRGDLETFVSLEAVSACVIPGRYELAPQPERRYGAFTDPSGGSHDSMTLAIGHVERDIIVIDAIREQPAPFDPDVTVQQFAALCREYGVSEVIGDRYAGEWPRERFRAHGLAYRVSELPKSELYLAFLPRINARTIELLDSDRYRKQLCALERRSTRGGRDTVDHPPGGRDDVVNAVAGVAHHLRARQVSVATITADTRWQASVWGVPARPADLVSDALTRALADGAEAWRRRLGGRR